MKINGRDVCIGCMRTLEKTDECPYCHLRIKEYKPIPRCLLPGTTLAERYILGKVLGEGSFGITYLAWDYVLEVPVAIKEYFPVNLVSRDIIRGTDTNVYAFGNEEEYKNNLDKFIEEARYLTRFSSQEGIVSVRDFFYANQTAYMVMEYVDGGSVKSVVKERGKMDGREVLKLIKPILTALAKVHKTGLIHRDISPDNMLFNEDGKLVLIDFGATRVQNVMDMKSRTVIYKQGFSPEEQYRPRGPQGEWTDVEIQNKMTNGELCVMDIIVNMEDEQLIQTAYLHMETQKMDGNQYMITNWYENDLVSYTVKEEYMKEYEASLIAEKGFALSNPQYVFVRDEDGSTEIQTTYSADAEYEYMKISGNVIHENSIWQEEREDNDMGYYLYKWSDTIYEMNNYTWDVDNVNVEWLIDGVWTKSDNSYDYKADVTYEGNGNYSYTAEAAYINIFGEVDKYEYEGTFTYEPDSSDKLEALIPETAKYYVNFNCGYPYYEIGVSPYEIIKN